MVLAHRGELLDQAEEALFYEMGMSVEVEKAGLKAAGHSDVVVASVQTLKGKRLESWAPDAFSTIVVDEGHHSVAAGYRKIRGHFSGAAVLGVTATPKRADKIGLKNVYDSIANSAYKEFKE